VKTSSLEWYGHLHHTLMTQTNVQISTLPKLSFFFSVPRWPFQPYSGSDPYNLQLTAAPFWRFRSRLAMTVINSAISTGLATCI
jgi:hypothetical protein